MYILRYVAMARYFGYSGDNPLDYLHTKCPTFKDNRFDGALKAEMAGSVILHCDYWCSTDMMQKYAIMSNQTIYIVNFRKYCC